MRITFDAQVKTVLIVGYPATSVSSSPPSCTGYKLIFIACIFVLLQEVDDLVVSLHNDCVKFIRGNLFKVTRSEGWKRLKLATQREIKEGIVKHT